MDINVAINLQNLIKEFKEKNDLQEEKIKEFGVNVAKEIITLPLKEQPLGWNIIADAFNQPKKFAGDLIFNQTQLKELVANVAKEISQLPKETQDLNLDNITNKIVGTYFNSSESSNDNFGSKFLHNVSKGANEVISTAEERKALIEGISSYNLFNSKKSDNNSSVQDNKTDPKKLKNH